MLYWRYAVQALGIATIPLVFAVGYQEGKATHVDQELIRSNVDKIILGENNTFWKRAILPPIRKITDGNSIIWYSTALRVPIAVYEKKKDKSVYNVIKHKLLDAFQPTEQPQTQPIQGYTCNQLSSHPSPLASIFQNSQNLLNIWDTFSTYQKNLEQKCDEIEVVNGPIFTHHDPRDSDPFKIRKAHYDRVGETGPSIPNKLYKIIRCKDNNTYYTSGFIFNNNDKVNNSEPLSTYAVPLEAIEMKTGLTFNLPGAPLVTMDSQTLNMTKEQYDRGILETRLLKSSNFDELRENYLKMKQHGISQSKATEQLLRNTYNSQIEAIRTYQGMDECQRYWQLIRVKMPKLPTYLHDIEKQLKTYGMEALRMCHDNLKLDNYKQFLQEKTKEQPELQSQIDDINCALLKD